MISDMCDGGYNCLDNVCDFYGGCIKGCIKTVNRKVAPDCSCLDKYYEDVATQNCLACATLCATCEYGPNICLSCVDNYYYVPATRSCSPCTSPCLNC